MPTLKDIHNQNHQIPWRWLLIGVQLLGTPFLASGQVFERPLHDHVWRFRIPTLTFQTGGDVDLTFADSNISMNLTTTSFYNSESGNTFTSNGSSIFLSSNGLMLPNGDSISYIETISDFYPSGMLGPDLAIFLPQFEDSNFPLLFHISQRGGPVDTLNFIDHYDFLMTSRVRSLDHAPYGVVEDKNSIVYSDTLDQGIAAIRHGNGRDWWINLNSRKRNEQHLLLYTPNGIEHHSSPRFLPDSLYAGLGHSSFSPDGNYFAKVKFRVPAESRSSTTMIYEFNRCTGELKKLDYITNNLPYFLPAHGIAFSPNSRFLYVGLATFLVQYDLEAENIEESGILIWEQNEAEAMTGVTMWIKRLGPDGKIYIGAQGAPGAMHVIHNPNLRGEACNFEFMAIDIGGHAVQAMPNSPLYGVGPLDNSPCDTLNINHPTPEAHFEYVTQDTQHQVEFYDGSSVFVTDFSWNFGDDQTSIEQYPIHNYESPGTYWVCLEVSSPGGSDITCDSIEVGLTSSSEPGREVTPLFELWPNPSTGNFTISNLSGIEGNISIYDSNGKVIYSRSQNLGQTQQQFQLSNIPAGMYIVQFLPSEGKMWSERLIVSDE